jgi:hypothetical protein
MKTLFALLGLMAATEATTCGSVKSFYRSEHCCKEDVPPTTAVTLPHKDCGHVKLVASLVTKFPENATSVYGVFSAPDQLAKWHAETGTLEYEFLVSGSTIMWVEVYKTEMDLFKHVAALPDLSPMFPFLTQLNIAVYGGNSEGPIGTEVIGAYQGLASALGIIDSSFIAWKPDSQLLGVQRCI